ncbi:hypothetical protein ACO0RG_001515 [Hanseniaspora osmophila]
MQLVFSIAVWLFVYVKFTSAYITTHGNAFVDSDTGKDFIIRGVAYQPGGSSSVGDCLSDTFALQRDIKYFQQLGINALRVYSIDNSLDHSAGMQMLKEAGIYLILDINTPGASINRPDAFCSYNSAYLQNVFAILDEFTHYDNVLGFFAGNEVIDATSNTDLAYYIKAVVRDIKNYMKARNLRKVPIGYSAVDISNQIDTLDYLTCSDNESENIDMFGVNSYSWCGESTLQTSGYNVKHAEYSASTVPVFFSEFGCNVGTGGAKNRPFTEIGALYTDDMCGVFSGGVVYEYSEEPNDFGLVKINADDSVTPMENFYNLETQYSAYPNPTSCDFTTGNTRPQCPAYKEGTWDVQNTSLPAMPDSAQGYFANGAGKGLGLSLDSRYMCDESNESGGWKKGGTESFSVSLKQATSTFNVVSTHSSSSTSFASGMSGTSSSGVSTMSSAPVTLTSSTSFSTALISTLASTLTSESSSLPEPPSTTLTSTSSSSLATMLQTLTSSSSSITGSIESFAASAGSYLRAATSSTLSSSISIVSSVSGPSSFSLTSSTPVLHTIVIPTSSFHPSISNSTSMRSFGPDQSTSTRMSLSPSSEASSSSAYTETSTLRNSSSESSTTLSKTSSSPKSSYSEENSSSRKSQGNAHLHRSSTHWLSILTVWFFLLSF